MPQILRTLAEDPSAVVESLQTMLLYVTATGSLDEAGLSTTLRTAFPADESVLMPTLAEKWMQQEIEKGIQQGEERGGRTGQFLLLKRIISRKFGPLDAAHQAQIEGLATPDLEKLSDQILDLSTVAELQKWLLQLG